MTSLQLLLLIATPVTAAAGIQSSSGNTQAPILPYRSDLKVKRNLLEGVSPVFSTFKGDMYAGMIPAVLINDETSSSTDFSSYMFWLFQPDQDANIEVSVVVPLDISSVR